jgi:hypothetical protein
MKPVAVVCLVVVLAVLAGCHRAAPAMAPASPLSATAAVTTLTGPLYGEAAGRARAEALQDLLQLPPGAVRLTVSPLHRLGSAANQPAPGQTVVDDPRWWRAPGTLGQFAARLVPYPGFPECEAPVAQTEQSTLTLTYNGHRAEFDLSFGCGGVSVLIDGKEQPYLDRDAAAAALTLHLLGVRPIHAGL